FQRVRLIGAAGAPASNASTVLLAADFEKGCVRVKVRFAGDRLTLFDLNGPNFLVEAYAAPAPDGRLLRYHWQGKPAPPISVLRDPAGTPTGLRFGDSPTP